MINGKMTGTASGDGPYSCALSGVLNVSDTEMQAELSFGFIIKNGNVYDGFKLTVSKDESNQLETEFNQTGSYRLVYKPICHSGIFSNIFEHRRYGEIEFACTP